MAHTMVILCWIHNNNFCSMIGLPFFTLLYLLSLICLCLKANQVSKYPEADGAGWDEERCSDWWTSALFITGLNMCVCACVHIPWPLVSSSSPLHPKRKQFGSDCALLPSSLLPLSPLLQAVLWKVLSYPLPLSLCTCLSLPLCIILLPWAESLSQSFMPLALPPQCISESVISERDRHLVQQKSAPYARHEWWRNGSLGNKWV